MKLLSKILIGFVAIEHVFILWIEMFAWERVGSRVFPVFPPDFFPLTTSMAANQGLYNGFLAAGLIWSLFVKDKKWSFNISLFFLLCVIIAAVFGAATVDKKIVVTQGVPAILALFVLFFSPRR